MRNRFGWCGLEGIISHLSKHFVRNFWVVALFVATAAHAAHKNSIVIVGIVGNVEVQRVQIRTEKGSVYVPRSAFAGEKLTPNAKVRVHVPIDQVAAVN